MIKRIRLFTRVADSGSFTAVANEFSVAQPTVSKAIKALERELDVRLFHRNTRGLVLTEEGRAAYEAGLRLLESYESLIASSQSAAAVRGVVRIAVPMALGTLHILPALQPFLSRHPELVADVRLDDSFVDLVSEGIDIAVRVGEVKDSRLAARPLGRLRRQLVAGVGYLAEQGEPTSPADLKHHRCIVHGTQYAHRQWSLRRRGRKITVAVGGNLVVDNILGIRAAVAANLGIGLVGEILLGDLTGRGDVKPVLTGYEPDSLPVTILFPDNKYVPTRVRRVIEHLAGTVRAVLADPGASANKESHG